MKLYNVKLKNCKENDIIFNNIYIYYLKSNIFMFEIFLFIFISKLLSLSIIFYYKISLKILRIRKFELKDLI